MPKYHIKIENREPFYFHAESISQIEKSFNNIVSIELVEDDNPSIHKLEYLTELEEAIETHIKRLNYYLNFATDEVAKGEMTDEEYEAILEKRIKNSKEIQKVICDDKRRLEYQLLRKRP